MTTYAFDLGTTTGWAVDCAGVRMSGVWNLKGGRFEGGGMRFVRFRGLLDELLSHAPPGKVVFEEVRRHAGTDAAHIYGGLMATLTAWCEQNEVPYEGIPVGTIKKHWTGKGNANKAAMLAEAKRREIVVSDDNECDALALLDFVLKGGAA